MNDYKNLASELVSALKKQGADACDVYITSSEGFNTTVRLGNIEKLQQSTSKGLGLRVFKNGATALTFTTDFQGKTVNQLVKETLDIVKVSNSDKFNGLAPKEFLGEYKGKLMIFDESLAQITPEKKIAMVKEMEEAGRSFDKRIANSNGASWSNSIKQVTLANSDGFIGQYQTTNASMTVGLLAEENGVKQTDYWYSSNRFFNKLESPTAIGKEAGRRVIARLGGKKVKSQVVPVVIDPEVASEFVEMVFGAASGGSIYRRSSYLIDKVGQEIVSPNITIIDDATIEDGLASRPFDAEGVKSSQVTVIENGVLKTYVCDSYSARRLNAKVTGNAGRNYSSSPTVSETNLFLKNGKDNPKDIIKSVKNGLYLTEMFGSGVNSVTGDFSQGASGFWIENGEITYPVQEITIAGNILKVLKNVQAIGNNLSFKLGSTASPTLLISEMTVGGE
ncbi:MAG: TldD/PmbA family protein [Pyrinomonadaceae bacterium]|jgi:PmbA protein|nr:TldD/PmbA family protein [Pyrinomonadaceae bacterium]